MYPFAGLSFKLLDAQTDTIFLFVVMQEKTIFSSA